MARDLVLNGESYTIADPSRVGVGPRVYQTEMVTSQSFDAATVTQSWGVSGPLGKSRAAWDGQLGIDYCDNLDHRYDWLLTSTAKRNAVALGTPGGPQIISPVADVTVPGDWSEGAGNANGVAYDEVDDPFGSPDDATTYWTTASNSSEIIFQCGLPSESIASKTAILDQFFTVARVRNSVTSYTVTITLYEGASTIAANTSGTLTGTDWQSVITGMDITQAEMDTITDFNNLRIGVQRASGSGNFDLTQAYVQLPNPYFACTRRSVDDTDRIFVDHGNRTAQIDPADMGWEASVGHGSIVTDSIAEWGGAGHVALGSDDLVQERTIVGGATPATYADVTGVDAFFLQEGADRLWLIDAGITTAADKNKAKYTTPDVDTLTSAALSNPFKVADVGTTVTGLYTVGPYAVVAHTRGVNSYTSSGKSVRLLEVLRDFPSVDNGRAGGSLWGWLYVGTKLGLYAINVEAGIANPVGPGEGLRGQGFEGAIDGHPTAVLPWKDSLWVSYLTSAGEAYTFRGMFGPETAATGRPEWYCFRKSDAPTATRLLGATALRQNPTLIVGENQDIAYYTLGRRGRDIADADYLFDTGGGTAFFTTLMLPEGAQANFTYAKFRTENCDASNTWALSVDLDDSGSFAAAGSAVEANGLQTIRPAAHTTLAAFSSIKPKLTQVAASESAPPQIRGELSITMELRPDMVRELTITVSNLTEGDIDALEALCPVDEQSQPVTLKLPTDANTEADRYAHVRSCTVVDRTNPDDIVAQLVIREWELT